VTEGGDPFLSYVLRWGFTSDEAASLEDRRHLRLVEEAAREAREKRQEQLRRQAESWERQRKLIDGQRERERQQREKQLEKRREEQEERERQQRVLLRRERAKRERERIEEIKRQEEERRRQEEEEWIRRKKYQLRQKRLKQEAEERERKAALERAWKADHAISPHAWAGCYCYWCDRLRWRNGMLSRMAGAARFFSKRGDRDGDNDEGHLASGGRWLTPSGVCYKGEPPPSFENAVRAMEG